MSCALLETSAKKIFLGAYPAAGHELTTLNMRLKLTSKKSTLSDIAAALASDAPDPLPLWPVAVMKRKPFDRSDFPGKELHRVCKMYGIPIHVESKLQGLVEDMRMVKAKVWAKSKTAGERKDKFEQIEHLAFKLKMAIMGLKFEDRAALDSEYFGYPGDPHFNLMLELVEDPKVLDLAGSLIPDVENAARNVRSTIKGVGIIARHADFIRCIAQALELTNIKQKDFNEVSIAVFLDAKVAMSDSAMKYFTKNIRPKMRKNDAADSIDICWPSSTNSHINYLNFYVDCKVFAA